MDIVTTCLMWYETAIKNAHIRFLSKTCQATHAVRRCSYTTAAIAGSYKGVPHLNGVPHPEGLLELLLLFVHVHT